MAIIDTIKNWGDGVKSDLISNYIKLGLKASGNWQKEIESKTETVNGSSYRVTILGSSYSQQIISGREKNRNQQNIRAFVGWAGSTFLAEWVRNKGIDANPYAVAYKIAREGIRVPNMFNKGTLISDVITDERINDLLKSVLGNIVGEIKTDLIKNFR